MGFIGVWWGQNKSLKKALGNKKSRGIAEHINQLLDSAFIHVFYT